MHTLIFLTAVISALPPEPMPAGGRAPLSLGTSTPSWSRGTPSTALSALQAPRIHVLDTMGDGQGNAEAANRIFLQFVAGSGLGFLGGGLTGLAMSSDIESPASLVTPISILALGSGAGVALVGAMMDGRGRFGYALLGSIIGSVAPIIIGMGLIQLVGCEGRGCEKPIVVSMLGLLVLPSVGAIAGYELSAPKSWLLLAHAPGKSPAPRQVVPVVTLARQGLGGTVGFAWTL